MNTTLRIKLPTPQTEILGIFESEVEYTKIVGKAVEHSRDSYLQTDSIEIWNDMFLRGKNLFDRTKKYNMQYINNIEDGYRRLWVHYKTNNHNFANHKIIEYFIPAGAKWIFSHANNDKNDGLTRVSIFESYESDDVNYVITLVPEEYHNSKPIPANTIHIEKYNPTTKRFE